eukprot:g1132.t1
MSWTCFYTLRGTKTAPEGSLTEQYKDLQESKREEASVKAAQSKELHKFRANVQERKAHARTAEERNEQLLMLVEELNARIEFLERQQELAEAKHRESYAGLKRTVNQLACGGLAGAIARTSVAPMDRVKILLQTQHLVHLGQKKYTGIFQTMQVIIKEEGVAKLWRGNGVNVIRVVPYSATQFAAYDFYKSLLLGDKHATELTTVERLLSGALAGMTATSITHPLDVVRLRLAVNPELVGWYGAFKDVVSENGARSLMKGYTPTLLSLAPFIGINFATFDTLKTWYYPNDGPKNSWIVLLLGASAGIFAQTCCYPLDTIRRRMQLKGHNYDSTLDCMRKIASSEGVFGFYRGMLPNALKVVPQNAIRFVAFEALRGFFNVKKKEGGVGGMGGG